MDTNLETLEPVIQGLYDLVDLALLNRTEYASAVCKKDSALSLGETVETPSFEPAFATCPSDWERIGDFHTHQLHARKEELTWHDFAIPIGEADKFFCIRYENTEKHVKCWNIDHEHRDYERIREDFIRVRETRETFSRRAKEAESKEREDILHVLAGTMGELLADYKREIIGKKITKEMR